MRSEPWCTSGCRPRRGRAIRSRTSWIRTTSGVAETAHLFQEYITKAYEIRLTVVDQVMWAVRIDVPDDDAAGVVDWRADYANLTYSLVTVPEALRAAVNNLMYGLRLRFAALDFGVTPNGEPV